MKTWTDLITGTTPYWGGQIRGQTFRGGRGVFLLVRLDSRVSLFILPVSISAEKLVTEDLLINCWWLTPHAQRPIHM